MKRLPIVKKDDAAYLQQTGGKVWFQTPEELTPSPELELKKASEFGIDPDQLPEGVDRRSFLTLMGASAGLAVGIAGCRKPAEQLYPFSKAPETDYVPGRAEHYATSIPFYGTAVGLLVKSVDGRPIKIEGNPEHPQSQGAASAFIQASLLDLYDPDRSRGPKKSGADATAADAMAMLTKMGEDLRPKQGKGLLVIVEDHRSPTTARAIESIRRDMPEAKFFRFEPFGRENQRTGAKFAFGEPRDVSYRLEEADVVVSFDADLLGMESSPIRNSKGFARRRKPETGSMSRIFVAEPAPTVTGHAADHRLRASARKIPDLVKALGGALAKAGVPVADGIFGVPGKLDDKDTKWVEAVAKDLAKAKKAVIAIGNRQHPAVHALGLALNHALGMIGVTVHLEMLLDDLNEGVGALAAATELLNGNQSDTVLILGGNPVFNAPSDLGFAEALKKAKHSVHVALHADETSAACTWHIPRAHFLESWSDARSDAGDLSIIQPLIAPLYDGMTDAQVLEVLVGGTRSPYELVMNTWGAILGSADFDDRFRETVQRGIHPASEPVIEMPVALNAAEVTLVVSKLPAVTGDFDVLFAPCPHAYDGRFANNTWLMELPDPIHKGTWMTMAAVSHATAKKLGAENGDIIDVTVAGKTVSVPVVISYGQADDSVLLPVGMGRKVGLCACENVGVDVNPVRTKDGWTFSGGTCKRGTGHEILAITQGHFIMEERPLIRTQTIEEYKAAPKWAAEMVEHPPLLNLFKDWEYKGHKWAMAIDLTLCTGCNACVTACQAENNIPVVGVTGVLKSREMHWIRIDRYFAGVDGVVAGADDAEAAFMPMLCQHCENAPCEQVCPVAATTHSPEGLNEMTYNRCIGTKYCGNNCPYKVRRFNFFNYNADIPETKKLGLNPQVTVRFRGVMEKCSFCIQRINQAKVESKLARDTRKDIGAAYEIIAGMQTACMQACPTEALTFGDLSDPSQTQPSGKHSVRERADLPRAYHMLEELNIRPRISYLGRIQNPHADLAPPPKGDHHKGEDANHPAAADAHPKEAH